MNTRRLFKLAALLPFMCVSLAYADSNEKQRMRTFAALPDWSGVWEQFNVGASGIPVEPQEFIKVLTEHPPYNLEWETKYQTALKNVGTEPEHVMCAYGFPALMMGSPFAFEAMVTPEATALIFSYRETRRIYTDGRPHLSQDDSWPTPWGESIGHWEGQTLVIDTIATSSPLVTLAIASTTSVPVETYAPLSAQAHFIERVRMLDKNTLENQITIDDPIAFTHPWRVTRQYHRARNMDRIVDEDCRGNDRNPLVDGKFTIASP